MSAEQAEHAIFWFGLSHVTHPWSLVPLLVTWALLPFIDPARCSARCARVVAQLGHESGADIHLIFYLLILLTLPLCVDLLWRLAKRYRLREAHQARLAFDRRQWVVPPYVEAALGVLIGLGLALHVLYLDSPVDALESSTIRFGDT